MRRLLPLIILVLLLISFGCGSGGKQVPEQPPTEKDTSSETNLSEKRVSPGDEILNEQGVRITYRGLEEGSVLGPWLMFDIENGSAAEVAVQTADVVINGTLDNFHISTNVDPGKAKDAAQTLDASMLAEAGVSVEEIEKVTLRVVVYDIAAWQIIAETDVLLIEEF